MANLPDPLVSVEVDLRDFQFMPLDVLRLRDSELAATPDAEAFRCAVLSWCVSWHQIPAGSLPDDDQILSRLLGFGRDLKGWKKVRANGGLHGWIKCSDGRIYHPVVAEKARDAWAAKVAQRHRTEAARRAREEARQKREQEQLQALSQNKENSVTEDVTASKGQGQGQGQGQGDLEKKDKPHSAAEAPAPKKPADEKPDSELQEACKKTWASYVQAYQAKYLVAPVRNAKVNAQIKQFVQRLGQEAPDVLGWYVGHPDAWYIKSGHSVDAALKDAEKLRTEWLNGRTMTSTKVTQLRPSPHVLPPSGVGAYGVTTPPTHPDAENFEGVM